MKFSIRDFPLGISLVNMTESAVYEQCSHHIETSQLIWRVNQLTDFYMMGTLVSGYLCVT